ncbi:MAG: hypothetical protein Fur0032_19340 [Terrimicrobiaceae bacterium]
MSYIYMPFLGSDIGGLNNYGMPFPMLTHSQAEAILGETITTGAGTYYPFQVPLSDAIRMWWVMAGIKADIAHYMLTITGECAPGDPVTLTGTSCDGGVAEFTDAESGSFQWHIGGDGPANAFWPPLMLSADPGQAWVSFRAAAIDATWSSIPSSTLTEGWSCDFVTPWFTRSLTLYKQPADSTLVTNDISVTFTVDAFRPFACRPTQPDGTAHPNAGLPIYNTTTGATLLDPVTGF